MSEKVLDSYILDLEEWPLRYYAVILTSRRRMTTSTMTYSGARRWLNRWRKRVREEQ